MNKKYLYWLLLIVLMAFLGWSTGIFTKIAVQEISPFWLTFLRILVASICMVPFVIHKIPRKHLLKLFLLSLFAAGNVVLFAFGVQYTTATSASVIYILSPIIVLLFGVVFLKHKFSKLNVVWVILGFLGAMTVILLPVFSAGVYAVWSFVGNLLIVLAMLSITIYIVWSKSVQKIFSPQTITAWFLLVTLIVTWIVSLIHPHQFVSDAMHLSTTAWLAILFVWVVGTCVQYLLQQIVIKKSSYLDWSLFMYIQPIATVILAIPILHERLTFWFIIGAVMALVGVWLSSRKP